MEPVELSPKPRSTSQSDPIATSQSPAAKVESQSGQPPQDEDGFIDVQHADVDMQDNDPDGPKPSTHPLELHRFGHSLGEVDEAVDDEDDSDDDRNLMTNHPLLSMLTGRLGARRRGSMHEWDRLHPENQALSVSNVDQCSSLENEAFPPEERASREKFQYRLTRCPELSLGLFTQPTRAEAEKLPTPPQRRLIAHIVSTRSPSPSVTEASMGVPSNWRTRRSSLPSDNDKEPLGHQDMGGTICLHSLAVIPEFQKMGLGSILMKSYIQRIKDSKCADRIALLTHDHLVPFYTGLGFQNMGPSAVTSCGGNWNNMVSHTHEHIEHSTGDLLMGTDTRVHSRG
ncbi:uncharacterized protein Z518_08167 [Rhinocladiella mackenziei CBS 650.93]|uniref:Rhinocladiella mackenziei CBS 650.93 unplaced genomic scaffold supercont1.6, whole genome shotgun sequence n=1 Tax=Rhinocladiella mackenziei CBS 650.93 TaxID=1442369 RepID=A0A0D2GVB7_9EURO|nr:uncharacterized protein Z518_08167 [Rhinocladiella mackenziei CBS 650.93]KIX02228.1 hypothetical protein Z518_08167 [Rhinocladiella mackenziei CBS 650.93]